MIQLSKKIEVEGWQNLDTLLRANGWTGQTATPFLTIYNPEATEVFVHRGSATSAGLSFAEGLPITANAFTWDKISLGNTMIYADSPVGVFFDLND